MTELNNTYICDLDENPTPSTCSLPDTDMILRDRFGR